MNEKTCPLCGEQYNAYIDFCFRDGEKLVFNASSDGMLDDTLSDDQVTHPTELGEEDESTETYHKETTGGMRLDAYRNAEAELSEEEPTEIDIFNDDQPTMPDIPKSFAFPLEEEGDDESLEGPTLLDNTLLFSRTDMSNFEEEEDTFISSEPMPDMQSTSVEAGAAEKLFGGSNDMPESAQPVSSSKVDRDQKSNGVGLVIIGVSSALTAIAVVSLLFLWTAKTEEPANPKEPIAAAIPQPVVAPVQPKTSNENVGIEPTKTVISTEKGAPKETVKQESELSEPAKAPQPIWKVVSIAIEQEGEKKISETIDMPALSDAVLDTSKIALFDYFIKSQPAGSYDLVVTFANGQTRIESFSTLDGVMQPDKFDFSNQNQPLSPN